MQTEQTAQHTPGPWNVIEVQRRDRDEWEPDDIYVGKAALRPDQQDRYLCKIDNQHDEDMANARLIAAAPDLLAALGYIESIAPDVGDLDDGAPVEIVITAAAIRDIRTAIAKARA